MLNWRDDQVRAALLKFWNGEEVAAGKKLAALIGHLSESGFIAESPRRQRYGLVEAKRAEWRSLLARRYPEWEAVLAALREAQKAPSAENLQALRREPAPAAGAFRRLHHKTYKARWAAHSKAAGTVPAHLDLTRDDTVRIRASQGLRLRRDDGGELDCAAWMALAGEVVLPERALNDGLRLAGTLPRLAMTVENLGAYIDFPCVPELLLIHAPGWNSSLARRLIEQLPPTVAWWHFGDLDPEGLEIFAALAQPPRPAKLWIPDFWEEYLASHALPLERPWPGGLAVAHPLLARLVQQQAWLEQEAIVPDSRLAQAVQALLDGQAA
jgi:hypothetical protein